MNASARADGSLVGRWWLTVDRWVLAALLTLLAVGAVMAFAASPAVAERLNYDRLHFVHRQLTLIPPAVVVMLAVSLLSPRGVARLGAGLFVLGLALTALTLYSGAEVKGARRWLDLGPLAFQPSELLKPGFAIVTAALLAARREAVAALFLAPALLVLALQPDIGMAIAVAAVWFGQYVLSGLPLFWVGALVAVGAATLAGSYFSFAHVQSRIDRFLDPAAGDSYQIDLSLRAFASGGLLGRGPAEGVVKENLPDAHADFVFSVAGEEFGLLACLLLVGVFAFIVLRGLLRLTGENDRFVLLAGAGVIGHFGLQALINMAVALRLAPTKGLTLPFVSYGGSSLLAVAVTAGTILALTRWRPGAGAPP